VTSQKDRKLKLAMLAMLLIVLLGVLSDMITALQALATALVSGIVSIFGLYVGGNVAHKWTVTRSGDNGMDTNGIAEDRSDRSKDESDADSDE